MRGLWGAAEAKAPAPWSWQPDDFVWDEQTPLRDWRYPIFAGLLYVACLLTIQRAMKSRQPYKLKGVTAAHNGILCIFSIVIFAGQSYETAKAVGRIGAHDVFCWQTPGPATGRLYFWSYLFYLSKYYELLDTVLLVLKKKPLDFLHCYHHSIVPFSAWLGFCGWYTYVLACPVSLHDTRTCINFYVHGCMHASRHDTHACTITDFVFTRIKSGPNHDTFSFAQVHAYHHRLPLEQPRALFHVLLLYDGFFGDLRVVEAVTAPSHMHLSFS